VFLDGVDIGSDVPEYDGEDGAPVVYPSAPSHGVQNITLSHTYSNGTHIFRGSVVLPTPCYEVKADVAVAKSLPEQLTLNLTTKATGDICAQVLAEKEFIVEVSASESAKLTGVYFDGKKIDISVSGDVDSNLKLHLPEVENSPSIRIEGDGGQVKIEYEEHSSSSSSSNGTNSSTVNTTVNVNSNTGGNTATGGTVINGDANVQVNIKSSN